MASMYLAEQFEQKVRSWGAFTNYVTNMGG